MTRFINYLLIGVLSGLSACTAPESNKGLSNHSGGPPINQERESERKADVPETLRQQISKEILAARIQARNRVLEKYPVFVGSKGLDETKIADRQKKRDSLEYELLRKAFSEILERYQLTPLQLTQIEKEAVSKGWISYPSPPPDYR